MIHGGDHTAEDHGLDGGEWLLVSNFSCENCGRMSLVYTPSEEVKNG